MGFAYGTKIPFYRVACICVKARDRTYMDYQRRAFGSKVLVKPSDSILFEGHSPWPSSGSSLAKATG